MERLFYHFKDQNSPKNSSYDPSNPETYAEYVKGMMDDAIDYENAFLAVDRNQAQLYYYGYSPWIGPYNPGEPYIGEDPNATLGEILNKDNENQVNRSTYVSTDVRDAVMMMLPGLVRLFGASNNPVFLVPNTEAESDAAEQATDYVNYVFWNDNPGFLLLYGAIKDALTVKGGFIKWWSEEFHERKRKRFAYVTGEQIQMLLMEDPSAKLVSVGRPLSPQELPPQPPGSSGPTPPPTGPSPGPAVPPSAPAPASSPPPPTVYEHVVVEFEISKPLIKVAGVPPEEMRLDRYARTFRDSRIVGHQRIVAVDQLIAMGYPRELCNEHIQTSESAFTTEPQLRNPGRFMGTRLGDGVKYGEWYVKVDKDGDGSPELRYICTMGENNDIVSDDEANRVKFALFGCDPISHTIMGDSLSDFTEDIQRIKTNAMRAILDSAAESINPKTVINELMVTVDDAMNDDVGAVIRTRGDVSASVAFTNVPFLGQQMLPVIDKLDEVLQRRTGLSDAAKGLDPKALQSSTMIGVEAVINGAQERVELVARVLCETGFKDLFNGLFNEICENPNQKRTLKIRGKWIPYDTSTFDASMTAEVNPNLGKGSDMVRMLALNQIKQDQQMIIQQFGLGNPVCGLNEYINTITDMLSIANIKNVGRYFKTPDPQTMQQIAQQPKPPDPMAVAAQAQLEKVRSESAKALAQQQLDQAKLVAETQFKHQQLAAKTAIDQGRLQIDGAKAHIDHFGNVAKITSQLMNDEQQRNQADQDSQIKMAQAQNDADQTAQQGQQADNDAALKAAQTIAQHRQNMSQIASGHVQAMTDMAAKHHQAMEQIRTGVQNTHTKLIADALSQGADHVHEAHQKALDRDSAERTTAATLQNQQTVAKMKPKPGRR